MTSILKTTFLGEIRGKTENGVTQYLGIKYASLKNRLADAELIKESSEAAIDATKDGPTAVSLPTGCEVELNAIQHSLPKKQLTQSDLDCLNLNITLPSGTTPSSKLPVFLFIHGGGLDIGANSWPQFNFARFVELSKEKNLAVIAVSINYRLGAFGFLTSSELRDAGYKANNGIRDQRIAMRWVQRHINDFGGDPLNVTLAGMSAGGASVTYHLHSDEPLFKRAIVMSGTFLFIRALPYEVHEKNYQRAIEALGLAHITTEAKLQALLETPGYEIMAKVSPAALTAPAIDGDMVLPDITFAEVGNSRSDVPRGKAWCRDLMIGDAQNDSSIILALAPNMKSNCAKRFSAAMRTVLAAYPNVADRILAAYGITEETSDSKALLSVLDYFNDAMFFAPVLTFARGWNGNAHVYYFNEGNPWKGTWKGRATHILDLAYLFQNFREFLTAGQQKVGNAFAEDIFKFCHGSSPWPAVTEGNFDKGFSARVYGPSDKGLTRNVVNQAYGGETMRRDTLRNLAAGVSLDDLVEVFVAFKATE
ncbi:hypothetical protein PENFLA_c062G07782 [Penicillium flavigenum]|uniref:Carboxylic ester hydrolase n=1 Tax=Penicillium flavigenum TaxID=254877 RepID=A0A1V6SFM5_9EURO|nr:hypothetical protein PENFLA_c062G07782 [Penicillium flavigenum]